MPSRNSQRGGKANGSLSQGVVLVTGSVAFEQYKGRQLFIFKFFIPTMSNIIPLPFESSLSASYADASELAQAMQRLEHHLAHVVNIWVTSKWFRLSCNQHCTDDCLLIGLLESWPLPSGAEQFQMRELMDCLALENQVIEGMMGQLHMVCNFNNMLIKRWDPGHVDAGNGWAAAAAWEQE